MYLAKLSDEAIGCYHSKPTPAQFDQRVGQEGLQEDILDQIDRLEAIQAEFGSICGQIKESIRTVSKSH